MDTERIRGGCLDTGLAWGGVAGGVWRRRGIGPFQRGCSQCRPRRGRLSRRRRCARPPRSKAPSNCFISSRRSPLKEERIGVITGAARVRGFHSNHQQCTFFLRPITFTVLSELGFGALQVSHYTPMDLFISFFFLLAISVLSEAAQCD